MSLCVLEFVWVKLQQKKGGTQKVLGHQTGYGGKTQGLCVLD